MLKIKDIARQSADNPLFVNIIVLFSFLSYLLLAIGLMMDIDSQLTLIISTSIIIILNIFGIWRSDKENFGVEWLGHLFVLILFGGAIWLGHLLFFYLFQQTNFLTVFLLTINSFLVLALLSVIKRTAYFLAAYWILASFLWGFNLEFFNFFYTASAFFY